MSETSPTTSPDATVSPPVTEPTATTPPTSSTTPSPSTAPAPKTDDSVLGGEPKPAAPAAGAPETYADFRAPEGWELDKTLAAEAGAIFKKFNLTQDQAQELVDFYASQSAKASDRTLQSVKDMRAGWVGEIRDNPAYRSEFDASGKIRTDSKVLEGIGRMLDSIGDKKLAGDFRQALSLTGAGDHPAVFAMLHRLSAAFAEGTPVTVGNPSPFSQPGGQQRRAAAQEIWPKLPSSSGA